MFHYCNGAKESWYNMRAFELNCKYTVFTLILRIVDAKDQSQIF